MIGRHLLRRWARSADTAKGWPETEAVLAAARTHVGKVRDINEDRFLVRSDRGLWAVADGMGGHAGGGDAADMAIAKLAELSDDKRPLSEAAIRAAMRRANHEIRANAQARAAVSGTTIVIAWLAEDRLSIFWAGDSRAYLMNGGAARCLTRDHSIVQDLIDAGDITPAQAERHPHAHLVTRALGATDTIELDLTASAFRPGDRVILCSDGVSRSLDLTRTGLPGETVAQLSDDLLAQALVRDGSDNATLIAIERAAPPIR